MGFLDTRGESLRISILCGKRNGYARIRESRERRRKTLAQQAPDFCLPTWDDRDTVCLRDYRGKVVLLSFWVGVAVYVIVGLGTALPNTPANVGSYQFFTVLGLTLFGVDKTSATGFSLVAFTLLSLPLLLIGFLALSRSGMSLAAIRDELRRPERDADDFHPQN